MSVQRAGWGDRRGYTHPPSEKDGGRPLAERENSTNHESDLVGQSQERPIASAVSTKRSRQDIPTEEASLRRPLRKGPLGAANGIRDIYADAERDTTRRRLCGATPIHRDLIRQCAADGDSMRDA